MSGPSGLDTAVVLPPELRGHKLAIDGFVHGKIRQFARLFVRRLEVNITPEQLELCVAASLQDLAAIDAPNTPQNVRLVLRHDCQSTGCGEFGCALCQYNPNRLCTRNLKAKYLIEDHVRAKCGAALRVEMVDDGGHCVPTGALPPGGQLEVHVLNGEKYKELCPDNTLLSHNQLIQCMVTHHKALLRRDGMPEDQIRVFLQPERGQAPLSELQVTTSSEALLSGKAPTFRLLVWAVDAAGEQLPHVMYVVSESFVVATKRVKHAIKSDIPSVVDNVSKIVHIGKATVEKLKDLRSAAAEEGWGDLALPDNLNTIDKVGEFKLLIECCEGNMDLRNKIRHLLKLSPEKWEDVCAHSASAVVPDFRPRVWWCAPNQGLLFPCRNGSVVLESLAAVVVKGPKGGDDDQVLPLHQVDARFNLPKLKTEATAAWYLPTHPGWTIYWRENAQDPAMQVAQQLAMQQMAQHPGGAGAATATAALHAVTGHSHMPTTHSPLVLYPGMAGVGALAPAPAAGAIPSLAAGSTGGMLDLGTAFLPLARPSGVAASPPPTSASARKPSPQPPRQPSPFHVSGRVNQTSPSHLAHQQLAQRQHPSQAGHMPVGHFTDAVPTAGLGAASRAPAVQPSAPAAAAGGTSGTSTEHSPFAASGFMADIQDAFPLWPNGNAPAHGSDPTAPPMAAGAPAGNEPVGFPSIEMLKTEDLVNMDTMEGRTSMWALPSLNTDMRSVDWLPGLASLQQAGSGSGGALIQQDTLGAALQGVVPGTRAPTGRFPHAAQGAQIAAHAANAAGVGGSLSLRFSMSLDLDKVNE